MKCTNFLKTKTISSCIQRSDPPPWERSCWEAPSPRDSAVFVQIFLLGDFSPGDSRAPGHSAWPRLLVLWGSHTALRNIFTPVRGQWISRLGTGGDTAGNIRYCWNNRTWVRSSQEWHRSSSHQHILDSNNTLVSRPVWRLLTPISMKCGVECSPSHHILLTS